MKRIVSAILVCVLLVGSIFALTSCGKMLTGKYEAEMLVSDITYEFGAFGKVTCTIDPAIGDDVVTEGKYKFNDAGDKITITVTDDEGVEESTTYNFSSGEEDGVKYIKLDGIKYEKID